MKEWSKKAVRNSIIFLAAGVILGFAVTFAVMNLSEKDRTIAVVDGKKITESDLFNAMDKKSGYTTLSNIIDNMVVEESAKTYGISVSDSEIDEELKRKIAVEYHSESAFLESLKSRNLTMDDAREELRLEMLFDRIATKDIRINDSEVQKYYNENKEKFSVPEKRRISEIVIKNETDANAVRDRLIQGFDFESLAREKSIGTDREKGGDRGFIVKGKLNPITPEVEKVVFQIGKEEISPVIKSSDGFHIIKVTEISPKYEPEFEAIKELVVLKAKLERCKPFTDILNDLRKARKIEIKEKRYIEN